MQCIETVYTLNAPPSQSCSSALNFARFLTIQTLHEIIIFKQLSYKLIEESHFISLQNTVNLIFQDLKNTRNPLRLHCAEDSMIKGHDRMCIMLRQPLNGHIKMLNESQTCWFTHTVMFFIYHCVLE